jgi:dihydroxyacid dehydratase/phosphogluconate dehydratase
LIGKIQTGDQLRLDSENGILEVLDGKTVAARPAVQKASQEFGFGRELFAKLRAGVSLSEEGASFIV